MKFLVIVQPQAKEDVARNAIWWADNHSVEQTIKWAEVVEEQLTDLENVVQVLTIRRASQDEIAPGDLPKSI